METVNFILILVVAGYLVKRDLLPYFSFEWNDTFWLKKKYGFVITKWTYPTNAHWWSANDGRPILQWNWRDPDNIDDSLELLRDQERQQQAQ